MTRICGLVSSIAQRGTCSSEPQSVQPEGREGIYAVAYEDWTKIQGQDPVADILRVWEGSTEDEGEPLVLSGVKLWEFSLGFQPAEIEDGWWAEAWLRIHRRQSAAHLGGRSRVLHPRFRGVRWRGDCPE